MNALCELETSNENTLPKYLKLYRIKHMCSHIFTYLHCWLILKDLPCWANMHEKFKNMLPKKCKFCDNPIELNTSET